MIKSNSGYCDHSQGAKLKWEHLLDPTKSGKTEKIAC